MERAQDNINVMQVKSPIAGIVAHAIQFRNGSITHWQEGDQMYRGNALVSIRIPKRATRTFITFTASLAAVGSPEFQNARLVVAAVCGVISGGANGRPYHGCKKTGSNEVP